jgi:hypothetical protein
MGWKSLVRIRASSILLLMCANQVQVRTSSMRRIRSSDDGTLLIFRRPHSKAQQRIAEISGCYTLKTINLKAAKMHTVLCSKYHSPSFCPHS